MDTSVGIPGRVLGNESPPFIVAELSGNHNQSLDRARALIDAAADAGADAVKLQTYTADTLTLPVRTARFRVGPGPWKDRYLYDLYQEAMTPWDWHPELAVHARKRRILLFSTPFDESAVDFLEREIDPPLHKISSFEVNHLPLLHRIGQTGKPVILSTGMATAAEIRRALTTLRRAGCPGVVLLKCVSAYPADPNGFNLATLPALKKSFRVPVGLSDHTLGNEVALGATALGASVIEKHFTLSRAEGGVDSSFSLEPDELAELCRSTRLLFHALGKPEIGPTRQDRSQLRFRRSIFVSAPIAKGEAFTPQNVKIVRPSDGLDPAQWERVLGKKAARSLKPGIPLRQADIR